MKDETRAAALPEPDWMLERLAERSRILSQGHRLAV